jgi:hypothetical protein
MTAESKRVESLTIQDFERDPIWEFTNREDNGTSEFEVRPVKQTPLKGLAGKLVGTQVTLAGGEKRFARLTNIHIWNVKATEQLMSLSIIYNDAWWHLERYFDPLWETRGPAALAKLLDLPIDAVFPIQYDLREFCIGNPPAAVGRIEKTPKERLSVKERMVLIVSSNKYEFDLLRKQ